MRWMGHVARMGDKRGTYTTFVERPEGKRLLDLGVDGRKILN